LTRVIKKVEKKMKTINFEVPVKVAENLEFTIKGSYEAPENLNDATNNYDEKTFLKIFLTGLRQIERNKVKAENNVVPVAKKLVELKVYKTLEESLNFILTQKGLK